MVSIVKTKNCKSVIYLDTPALTAKIQMTCVTLILDLSIHPLMLVIISAK